MKNEETSEKVDSFQCIRLSGRPPFALFYVNFVSLIRYERRVPFSKIAGPTRLNSISSSFRE